MLLSTDTNLTNGLTLLQTGYATSSSPARPARCSCSSTRETTIIPTSAISINDEQYVNYMSVKSWDTPGRWTNNYNAISVYDQDTDKWVLARSTIRSAGWFRSSTPYVAGSQNFQQAAYVLQPESQVPEGGTQYLYASERHRAAPVRPIVPGGADDITDLSKYEYWDGTAWTDKLAYAAPVIGDSTHSAGLIGPLDRLGQRPERVRRNARRAVRREDRRQRQRDVRPVQRIPGQVRRAVRQQRQQCHPRTADPGRAVVRSGDHRHVAAIPGAVRADDPPPWSGTGSSPDNHGAPDVSTLYWNMSLWGNWRRPDGNRLESDASTP